MDTKWENIRIVISGGAGFIFSHVVDYFVEKGATLLVIDNFSEGSHPELVDGWIEKGVLVGNMNVADEAVIHKVVSFNPDYIIHASAYSDVDVSITEPERVLRDNMLSNIYMFEAGRLSPNLKKFLYVSTDEVYGECDTKKKEWDVIYPKNPYSASKATGSLLRIAYDNTYPELKDKTVETRFCNVFGERQDERKILGRIKKSLQEGTPIPVHNGGIGYREYIYVKNIPPVIELLLEKGHRVYNVTTNDGYTVVDLITKVEEVTGKEINTVPAGRPGMDMKYQMDGTRIQELGWTPTYSFEESLKQYLHD